MGEENNNSASASASASSSGASIKKRPGVWRPFDFRSRRTRRLAGEVVVGGLMLTLIGITSAAALLNIIRKGWGADAAAWAQAAGAIIAIVGAAWLARGEARQARRWRREQGEEAAWGVRYALVQAQFDSQIIAAELTNADAVSADLDILSWRQRAANSSLILQTMLVRTDHVHPFVIATTCNAKILIDQLSLDLAVLEKVIKRSKVPGKQVVADVVYAHINLATLIEQYDARMRGVRQALDEGGDMLPIADWEPWLDRENKA